jgi:hypothetical protein
MSALGNGKWGAGVNNTGYDSATGNQTPEEHGNNTAYANVLQLRFDWADTSSQCWRQCRGGKGNKTSATRQRRPRNKGNNANAMLTSTTAQCRQ